MALEPRLALHQAAQQAQAVQIDQRALWAVPGLLLGFWLTLHPLYQALLVLIVADIVTGIMASLATGQKLSSDISWRGLVKKAMVVILVALSAYMEPWAAGVPVGPMVAGYFCAQELLSIIENYATAGLPVPQVLRDVLDKLSQPGPPPGGRGPMPPGALA